MDMPKDPAMLLSFVNMKLRDEYESFDVMCDENGLDREEIIKKLASIDYEYDGKTNQFV